MFLDDSISIKLKQLVMEVRVFRKLKTLNAQIKYGYFIWLEVPIIENF